MAINLIPSPLQAGPNVFAAPVINHLNAHLLNVGSHRKIANGVVRQGSLFNVGGAMYLADSDTAITGANTLAIAVKMTPSGNTLIPSYVSDLTGVTYSKDYLGWYDASSIYYELLYRPYDVGNFYTDTLPAVKGCFSADYRYISTSGVLSVIIKSLITGTVALVKRNASGPVSGHATYKSTDGGTNWTLLDNYSSPTTIFVDYGDLYKCEFTFSSSGYVSFFGMRGLAPEDIL